MTAKKKFYRVDRNSIVASANSENVSSNAIESTKSDPEIEPSSDNEKKNKESEKFYNNRPEYYAYFVTFILLFMRIIF